MVTLKDNLVAVLDQIQSNRAGLVKNIAEQEKQLVSMRGEVGKFDAVIAALQISIADHNVLSAVEQQHEHANKLPLTAPPAGPAAVVGGNGAATQASDNAGAVEVPAVANDSGATA
jgi:hypothetical protein